MTFDFHTNEYVKTIKATHASWSMWPAYSSSYKFSSSATFRAKKKKKEEAWNLTVMHESSIQTKHLFFLITKYCQNGSVDKAVRCGRGQLSHSCMSNLCEFSKTVLNSRSILLFCCQLLFSLLQLLLQNGHWIALLSGLNQTHSKKTWSSLQF